MVKTSYGSRRSFAAALLIGTALGGVAPLSAQAPVSPATPETVPSLPLAAPGASVPASVSGTIRSISVTGNQRLEADTVRSYIKLKAGDPYSRETLDQALKDLYATELFADVQINAANADIVIQVRENPVINRIVLEGNKRLKEDKIRPEIKLAPRQIFTRSKARADVARIIELYRRQGRFAATVEPKMVQLDQNRVDVVFEISEGAKSKVRRINIIGNEKFKDSVLRGEMATKESGITKIFSSGTSYDPDRLAYDQQKMRQFYLTNGYADFRVVSAVAELTPDKKDFIITYVVEEGQRYKFGNVKIESEIRDLKPATLEYIVRMKKGDWYNAKSIEDTVDQMTETAGLLGYAFADVNPEFVRDKDKLEMNVTFKVADAPRVYVERIDINGNTVTRDKVIRREFRLGEGDAFNGFQVKRSRDRIRSLGYFQEKLEVEQKQGSAPDRVVLETNVEEKATGQIQVSAGFSSLERFIVDLSVEQNNFMGKGQTVRASVNYSTYSKSVNLGFTEPYLFDKNIALGGDVFRRDYNSFNFTNNNNRRTTFSQVSTGFQIRAGVPLTEFTQFAVRYGLTFDEVTLDRDRFFFNGQCDPLLAGRYLCDSIGNQLTSSVGYSFVYDNLNNRLRPSRGQRVVLSQDFAGLGGDVRYVRQTVTAAKYFGLGSGFIFSIAGDGGYIHPLRKSGRNGSDAVRLVDRFNLGEPNMRGFGIRGIGPRVIRRLYDTTTADPTDFVVGRQNEQDDALGGRAYYHARAELEIPLGSGARELGLRPSIYLDAGSVFSVKRPALIDAPNDIVRDFVQDGQLICNGTTVGPVTTPGTTVPVGSICPTGTIKQVTTIPAFREFYFGDTPKPRLSVGFGVNWNSPFGPLRLDIAKALLKEPGDNTKLFTFNVGTQF